jgi:hypothetical protein
MSGTNYLFIKCQVGSDSFTAHYDPEHHTLVKVWNIPRSDGHPEEMWLQLASRPAEVNPK